MIKHEYILMGILNYFLEPRFCLNTKDSPTYFNIALHLKKLGWQYTHRHWWANFDEMHFLFDSDAAACLEYKHQLANLVSQYCPEIMPLTYHIHDQNWLSVLNTLPQPDEVWILKPSTLNNGQHIKIFNHVSQIEQHFLSTNRLGGSHVLQQYILHPHLLKGPSKGHKYSIRMFIVVTNYGGVYLYPQGYFNIAIHPYQIDEFNDIRSHLTNEHLTLDATNVMQVPTQRYDLFIPLYPQIKTLLTKVARALQNSYPQAFEPNHRRALALFGVDFMVDANERVWLLEANHGPCFPTQDDHPLQRVLYHDFWQALIASFILPIAKSTPNKNIQYKLFERIDTCK